MVLRKGGSCRQCIVVERKGVFSLCETHEMYFIVTPTHEIVNFANNVGQIFTKLPFLKAKESLFQALSH